MEKVKFTQITRTICPRTGIHYLDAISENGEHYFAEMKSGIERWLVFTSTWRKSGQIPYKDTQKSP
jgi:hypothetical protein